MSEAGMRGEEREPARTPGASRLEPLPLGTMTEWGEVADVGCLCGERYYWLQDGNATSMLPADLVEPSQAEGPGGVSPEGSDPTPTSYSNILNNSQAPAHPPEGTP